MKVILIGIILFCASCTQLKSNKMYEGEVYIKLIDIGSLYGAPKEMVEKVKHATAKDNTITEGKKDEIRGYFKLLIKHDLLEKSYFKMKLFEREIVNVFVNETNYLKIKPLIDNLNRDEEKIKVKFRGDKKEKDIYFANEIISINKVKGKTDWKK